MNDNTSRKSLENKLVLHLDKHSLFLFSFYIVILTLILNGNKFSAGLKFTLVPTVFFAICSLTEKRSLLRLSVPFYALALLFLSALYSTLSSDVVSMGTDAISLLLFIIFYIVITSIIYEATMIKRILRFYSLAVTVISIVMVISYLLGYNLINGRVTISFMDAQKDANYLAAFLAPGYAYLLYSYLFGSKKKTWVIFSTAIIFFAIFFSGSRAAFITISLVTLALVAKLLISKGSITKKIFLLFIVIAIAAAGFYYLTTTSVFDRMTEVDSYKNNIRLKIWGYALKAFTRKPIVGSGIQSGTYFAQLYLKWYTHNTFIDILTGQGLIGAALYLILYIDMLRVKSGNITFMGVMLIAFFAPMFFVNGYETATFWVPMMICRIMSDFCKKNEESQLLLSKIVAR